MTNWQEIFNDLDIIIPVYNGLGKLRQTIFSFGAECSYNFIIIADGDGIDYLPELEPFRDLHNIQLLASDVNRGPGIARNVGLAVSNRDLITFIDTGDTMANSINFRNLMFEAVIHPEYNMLSAAHYEENADRVLTIPATHNRMHGKIFRRQFLLDHGIKFNENYSRANEDIGVNLSVRMISQEQSINDKLNHICHFSDPVMCWKNHPDSITRKNDCAFYYKENNMGLAHNGGYAIELARKNGVREEIVEHQTYIILMSLFNFYFATKNYRPEFLEEQEEGAIYFVKTIMQDKEINYDHFLTVYNDDIKGTYGQEWNPFTTKIPDLTFMQWYDMIKEKAKNYSIKEE